MTNQVNDSRFVRDGDVCQSNFVYDMPPSWWSRPYEYAWAAQFARPDDVALDAACGLSHPLKFHLLDQCARVCACDLDPGIVSRGAIEAEAREVYGIQALPDRYFEEIDFRLASLTELPYEDQSFDRIFCISVLEHLTDRANKWAPLAGIPVLGGLVRRDIRDSLKEFKRVLKDGGQIVLTFDHPRINLDYLQRLVTELGLKFSGQLDTHLPDDAIYSRAQNLRCFRALLEKA